MPEPRTRIAIVDDDASVRIALGRLLRTLSYDVTAYSSGPELLRDIGVFDPQCIILDLNMPGLSGLEVYKRLLAKGSTVPVIIITGQDNEHAEAECLAAGACAYLRKPFQEDAIREAIQQAIGRAGNPR